MDVTVKEFVAALWDYRISMSTSDLQACHVELDSASDILHYGHLRGWLEDQDEVESESVLVRRSAARILHQFMKIELQIPDLNDISAADELKDLYTCRVCVNHVAQVYLRNLMEAEEVLQDDGAVLIFNMMKAVSKDEFLVLFQKLKSLVQRIYIN